MRKKNDKRKVISLLKKIGIIYCIFFIMLFFIGFALLPFIGDKAFIIPTISSVALGIPIFIGMIGSWFYFIIFLVKELFKTKKWYLIITSLLIVISVLSLIFGFLILFFGTSFENKYIVEKVKVIDVKSNKIIIDYTKFSHGDKEIKEIYKPFFINMKKGDLISIRYLNKNPEKMYYVIDSNIGENLIKIGITGIYIIVLFWIFALPIILFVKNRLKK